MKILSIILALTLDLIPGGDAFLRSVKPDKDTIRVADRVEYGFTLEDVKDGTRLALPDLSVLPQDTLALIRNWQLDTAKADGGARDITASIILAPFEEGSMVLPPLSVVRVSPKGDIDTLYFEPKVLEITPLQIDTATFEIKPLKPQIKYPLTFREVLPWAGGTLALAALIALAVFLIKRFGRKKGEQESASSDPSYIVALRSLEKYRGDSLWAPEKQKSFYSGVTDALKVYIEDRYGVDAPEMTTAELFDALKKCSDAPSDKVVRLKDMFEEADFVKFAKHFSDNDTLKKVVPDAIDFVMQTYVKPEEQEAPKES